MHLSPAAKHEAISLLDRGEDLKAEGENSGSEGQEVGPGRGAGVEQKGSGEGA